MTDQLTQLGLILGIIAAMVAALIGGLGKWTSTTPWAASVLSSILGVGVGILLHGWGLIPMITATGVLGIVYSGLLGLVASVMGHGATSTNVFNVFKPGA
jgi:hypothetical protein